MNIEFNEGDVLAEIGEDMKYVVEGVEVFYRLRRLYPAPNWIPPPVGDGSTVEGSCVKIGRMVDGKEVDDDDQT